VVVIGERVIIRCWQCGARIFRQCAWKPLGGGLSLGGNAWKPLGGGLSLGGGNAGGNLWFCDWCSNGMLFFV